MLDLKIGIGRSERGGYIGAWYRQHNTLA